MRRFIAELKRRHVFRVATVYLVAAWLVIQVATTVFPILHFSAWTVTAVVVAAIVGFPIALIVAWAFDLTSQGIERTDAPGRTVRLPWLRQSLAALIIVIIAAGGYTYYLRVKPGEAKASPSIAIFPFSVEGSTSLAYLGEGIVNLLSSSINGLGTMRSVDPNLLLNSLSASERTHITKENAQRIAQKVGASAYIIGKIEGSPDRVIITATMYDVAGKADPVPASVPAQENQIVDNVEQLAGVLLAGTMPDAASRLSRAAAINTTKLSALKFYLMGESEFRNARWNTAMSYFSRAVSEDTTFALASYRLAVAADWASEFDTARVAVDRALRHGQRLSGHDRDLLVAFNAALRGRADEAEAAYRHITADYPDDVEAWYRYGEVLYHYNPVRGRSVFESKPMFERALQAAPDAEPMVLHLMELALYKKDYANFDQLAKRVDATKPASLRRIAVRDYETGNEKERADLEARLRTAGDGDVFVIATGLAQFSRDLPGAIRIARILTDPARPKYVRGAGTLAIAQYHVARLDWPAAKATLTELAQIDAPYALEHEALWASMPFLKLPPAELQSIRSKVQAWKPTAADSVHGPAVYLAAHNGVHPLFRQYLIGVLSARLQDAAAAQQSAEALDAMADSAHGGLAHRLATAVRAHAAFNRADYSGALTQLEKIRVDANLDLVYNSVFWNGAYERFVRAETLRALNRSSEADQWYASLNEGRNEVCFDPVTRPRLLAFGRDDAK